MRSTLKYPLLYKLFICFFPMTVLYRKFFFVSLLLIISFQAKAQYSSRETLSGGVDLGVAFKNNQLNPSITYYELVDITKGKLFFIGWTGRLGAFYGHNTDYYTAPARLTRGISGLGSLSKPVLAENIDTISFSYASQTSLNIGVRTEIHLGRVEFGASADLLGFTFLGRKRVGHIRSSTGLFTATDAAGNEIKKPFQGTDADQQARPQRLNIRLLGDNDRGMLATEVYGRIFIVPGVALKAGYQWLSTEVVINNIDIVADNNRFRNRTEFVYFALTLPISPW